MPVKRCIGRDKRNRSTLLYIEDTETHKRYKFSYSGKGKSNIVLIVYMEDKLYRIIEAPKDSVGYSKPISSMNKDELYELALIIEKYNETHINEED